MLVVAVAVMRIFARWRAVVPCRGIAHRSKLLSLPFYVRMRALPLLPGAPSLSFLRGRGCV